METVACADVTRLWASGEETLSEIETHGLGFLGGVHRCCLSDPIHLEYMSPEFSAFCGYTIDELRGEDGLAVYAKIIHPDDVGKFRKFVEELAAEEGCLTIDYRVVRKNGDVVDVFDTMVSKHDKAGVMRGLSIVVANNGCDRGSLDSDIYDSIAHGFVELYWEGMATDKPRIKYCNDYFLNMLGISDDIIKADRNAAISAINLLFFEGLKSLVPWDAFSDKPISCQAHGFLRKISGIYVEVTCWAHPYVVETGMGCKLIIAPISEAVSTSRAKNKQEFVEEMATVYDLVVDVNLVKKTARCVHNTIGGDAINGSCDIPVGLDLAISDWSGRYFDDENRKRFENDTEPFLEMESLLSPRVLRRSYNALVHGQETPISMFIFRSGDYLLLMIRLIDNHPDCQLAGHRVRIRTFGYFEVFVDDEPIIFKHPKSRELFAILVDRQGGMVSSRTAASILWDDKEPDDTVMARYRKVAMYLTESLEAAGVGYLVESAKGSRRAVLSLAECDLVDYLRLGDKALASFNGAYMKEYSWAEQTLGELMFNRGGS